MSTPRTSASSDRRRAPRGAAAGSDRPLTVLAFDYGLRHIGVAVGQTVTDTASPLGTISGRGTRPDWDAIAHLVATWRPDALVVGEPLHMDGTEQAMTRAARRFARRLHGRFHLPVYAADERLSTREACARQAAQGRETGDHAAAAQVILETWLASRQRDDTVNGRHEPPGNETTPDRGGRCPQRRSP